MNNYNYISNMMPPNVVSFAIGDVNGDKIPDNVYLTGKKTPDSPFIQNITLIIQDGRTGTATFIELKENAGYNPVVYLYDFIGNGVLDILISITTGGSGGIMYYYIYSFINNIERLMFDFDEYNNEYQYEVNYKDYYMVEVISKNNNEKYIIDIQNKGSDYLNEIYDKDGKLKSPISGFVDPLSGLYPIDFAATKVYEPFAFQEIAGRYNADSLGYIQNTLKWDKNKFILDNQFVAVFGSKV